MPDFFPTNRELTIGEIVTLTRAKPRPGAPLDRRIGNIAPLDTARASDITFLDNAKYLDALAVTRAGACLLAPRFAARAPERLAVLVTPEPYRAFVAVARALFPSALRPSSLFGAERPRGRRAGASLGAARGGRDHRSAGGDRTRRRNRRRNIDRSRRGDRPGCRASGATARSARARRCFMR